MSMQILYQIFSVDFEPAVLASISWLMLAQAAELIHLKSASFER